MTDSPLFEPIQIRSKTIRNRIFVSPMCQYSCDSFDGVPHDWHLVHLGQFAAGGAGLVMAESTAVSPEGRITREDTGLWNNEQRDAWKRVTRFIRGQGAVPGVQLGHAGRKASDYKLSDERTGTTVPTEEGGWQTVAPSAIAFPGFIEPEPLDIAGIDNVVDDYRRAARRAVEAGFEVVEVHGAHGYLLHQFLSPLSNRRDDEYGGPLENRARLLLRVIEAVRGEIGEEVPLFVRLSATDWAEGGWHVDECVELAPRMREAGADFIDVSTGGLAANVKIPVGKGYQVPFAEQIKRLGEIGTNAVGLITTAEEAEEIISTGQADAVAIGREMLRNPHFALNAANALGESIDYWPHQYKVLAKRPRVSAEA